jgi:hypothetical protein
VRAYHLSSRAEKKENLQPGEPASACPTGRLTMMRYRASKGIIIIIIIIIIINGPLFTT